MSSNNTDNQKDTFRLILTKRPELPEMGLQDRIGITLNAAEKQQLYEIINLEDKGDTIIVIAKLIE